MCFVLLAILLLVLLFDLTARWDINCNSMKNASIIIKPDKAHRIFVLFGYIMLL